MAAQKHRALSARGKKLALEAGAGAAVAAGAAAAAYYLYTKASPKTKKAVKGWVLKAKKEVGAELKKLPQMSEAAYTKAIETVAKRYHALKNVDAKDVEAFVQDLKRHWPMIRKVVARPSRKKKK